MKTYYDILGVSPSASDMEIKEAFLLRTKMLHPDRFNQQRQKAEWDLANEMFKEISSAYDTLKNPTEREQYDFSIGIYSNQSQSSQPGNEGEQTSMSAEFCYQKAEEYFEGRGCPKSYPDAVKWCELAADRGHVLAQCSLGTFYYTGDIVPQNYSEAFKWFKLAAAQNNTFAQFALCRCYYNAQGVAKNNVEAVKWCKLAANAGYADAQCSLGNFYFSGDGVSRDHNEAIKWFKLAAAQGQADAKSSLERLAYFTDTSTRRTDNSLIYPAHPPLSPHIALINLVVPGVAQIIHGQFGKGILLACLAIASLPICFPIIFTSVAVGAMFDAYGVGRALANGQPVGKWDFMP